LQPGSFPARQAVLDRFQEILASAKLSQAYLLVGPEGVGKENTALEIARLANCPRRPVCTGRNKCESCQKAATFQHPDIRWLGPAPATATTDAVREILDRKRDNPFYQPEFATTSQVTIGNPDDPGPLTIRSLLRFLRLHAFQGRYKIAIISDAHRMTPGAANAFLKTLEEPPPNSLIFLLTSNRSGILPTIVSRCQQIRFDLYGEQELADLLVQLTGVEPARARGVARAADGNARKAMALLAPQVVALQNWAGRILDWIHTGRAGSLHVSADQLHSGIIPAEMAERSARDKLTVAKGSPARRERAIQLCEMLNLYYSELLTCRERGDDWRPRLPDAAERMQALAALRDSRSLLRDIAIIEAAKREVDSNLNIGLVMAVLFEGLIDHAQRDQTAAQRAEA
jgi:DNA polymerase III delta' subunit